jgi:hypothetical protein
MEEEVKIVRRPVAIILASTMILFIGVSGFIAGALVGVALVERNEALLPLENLYVFTVILWLVAGPLLIFAGYNLYHMKKWAARLASAIIVFDLLAGLPIMTFLGKSVDTSDSLALALDIVILVLIASAWEAYK